MQGSCLLQHLAKSPFISYHLLPEPLWLWNDSLTGLPWANLLTKALVPFRHFLDQLVLALEEVILSSRRSMDTDSIWPNHLSIPIRASRYFSVVRDVLQALGRLLTLNPLQFSQTTCVSDSFWWKKSWALHSCEWDVFTRKRRQRWMLEDFHSFEWSLVISLRRVAEPWFQANHRWHA